MNHEDLLELFVQDARELVDELERAVLELEKDPGQADLLNQIFRLVHTIKGNAGIVGLGELASYAHVMETALDALRGGRITADGELMDLLLRAVDLLRAMVDVAPEPLAADRAGLLESIMAEFRRCTNEPDELAPAALNRVKTRPGHCTGCLLEIRLNLLEDALREGIDPTLFLEELSALGEITAVELGEGELPPLREMDPRAAYLSWRVRMSAPGGRGPIDDLLGFMSRHPVEVVEVGAKPGEAKELPPIPAPESKPTGPALVNLPLRPVSTEEPLPAPAQCESLPQGHGAGDVSEPRVRASAVRAETVRVSVKVLDRLMELTGEMVLGRNQLLQSAQLGDPHAIERATQRVDLLTGDLQEVVMATRMQPLRVPCAQRA